MEIRFYVTGTQRKAFATVVGDLLGWEPVYKKAPTFAYAVNNHIIDKDGTLILADDMELDEAAELLAALAAQGYTSSDSLPTAVSLGADALGETAPATRMPIEAATIPTNRLSIALPWAGFTEQAYHNLVRLVESKSRLICQSIGAEELVIRHDEERIYFSWFSPSSTSEEVLVYTQLVTALCEMAKNQQRVVATKKAVENPKYAMRCFLLRLCFIGEEYAAARKLLLRNLSGSSSFKSGARKERPAVNAPNSADSAPLDAEDASVGDAPTPSENTPQAATMTLRSCLPMPC